MADNITKKDSETKELSEAAGLAENVGPVLKLSKTYNFEGDKVSEIDFSNHANISAKDMIKTDRILSSSGNLPVGGASENTMAYALVFASFCSDQPIEFFEALSPVDAIAVKNQVMTFFNGMV